MYVCGRCVRTETAKRGRIHMGLTTNPDDQEMSLVGDERLRGAAGVALDGSARVSSGFAVDRRPDSDGEGSRRPAGFSRFTNHANTRHWRVDSIDINQLYGSIQLH